MTDHGDSTAAVPPRRIDVHSHLCPVDLPDLAGRFSDTRWPILHERPDGSLTIMRDGRPYRPIDDRYFAVDRRIAFLDRYEIDVQVVSPLPVLLPHWAPAGQASEAARWQNEAVAEFVACRPDRLIGLGTVAPHDQPRAVDVLDQVIDLGLAGVEIGTSYGGHELGDAPVVEFFAAAAERDVPILIHPLEGAGMGRMDNDLVRFSVGVLSDTSLAVASLLLAGVLVDNPQLRICLSHGGGTFFWILPRLRQMLVGSLGKDRAEELVAAIGRVWVDSASLGVENLAYLQTHLGVDRIVLGSDFPAASRLDPGAALRTAELWRHPGVCHLHAERFLGLDLAPASPHRHSHAN